MKRRDYRIGALRSPVPAVKPEDAKAIAEYEDNANRKARVAVPLLLGALESMVNEFGGKPSMRKYLDPNVSCNKVVLDAIAVLEAVKGAA